MTTTSTPTAELAAHNRAICQTMLDQIGRMNLLAISGGRIKRTGDTTIVLPVHYGYSVEIEYIASADTYTVRRIFARGTKRWIKGEATNVYAEELGETAYRASCYLDEWQS